MKRCANPACVQVFEPRAGNALYCSTHCRDAVRQRRKYARRRARGWRRDPALNRWVPAEVAA